MFKQILIFKTVLVFIFALVTLSFSQGFVINHNNTNIDEIPDSVFEFIKDNYRLIHGHLSHGWQIDDGLDSLELEYSNLKVEVGNYKLPTEDSTLNIMYYYADAENYWHEGGPEELRGRFSKYPNINVAMFSWCSDLEDNDSVYVQSYLDSISMLENEFPGKTFIYTTGNAQETGEMGLLRYNNNNIIRDYCEKNNKILFDFADLDCWWYNPDTKIWEDSYYTINGIDVPIEHPTFHYDEWHHTIVESGIQKAKAIWYLLARLSGWEPLPTAISLDRNSRNVEKSALDVFSYPNPFNSQVSIKIRMEGIGMPELKIYNSLGEVVFSQKSSMVSGEQIFHWNANYYSSGIYFYRVQVGMNVKTGKLLLIE